MEKDSDNGRELVKADRKEITQNYYSFNIAAPATDEEFDDALGTVMQYLLFGSKWDPVAITDKRVLSKIPIIQDIPLRCEVRDCPYAAKCPLLRKARPQEEAGLMGTDCRADKLYAAELFSTLIQDLEVGPENTVDLINVASLVRLMVIQRRIDWAIALDGIELREVSAIDQRSGQAYLKLTSHPLLKEMERLQKQISVLQTQLMANRKERLNYAASIGKGGDLIKNLLTTKLNPTIELVEEEESVD